MDLQNLTSEATELHQDALEATRVSDLCARAAGQRLVEIRDGMTRRDWLRWLDGECPMPKVVVGQYIRAALDA